MDFNIEVKDFLGNPLDKGDYITYPSGSNSPVLNIARIEDIVLVEKQRYKNIGSGKYETVTYTDYKLKLQPLATSGYRVIDGKYQQGAGKFKKVTITNKHNVLKIDYTESDKE